MSLAEPFFGDVKNVKKLHLYRASILRRLQWDKPVIRKNHVRRRALPSFQKRTRPTLPFSFPRPQRWGFFGLERCELNSSERAIWRRARPATLIRCAFGKLKLVSVLLPGRTRMRSRLGFREDRGLELRAVRPPPPHRDAGLDGQARRRWAAVG